METPERCYGAHVRFRLGGNSFPPTIFYKIYTHQPLCDVGAFAPKDYTRAKQLSAAAANVKGQGGAEGSTGQALRSHIQVGHSIFETKFSEETAVDALQYASGGLPEGWYDRFENNDWRPVTLRSLQEGTNESTQRQQDMAERFHYSRLRRKQDRILRKKRRKREWMKKLYMHGFVKEREEQEIYQRGKDDREHTVDFDDPHWEEEANDLLTWTDGLDFDNYMNDWRALGTTAGTEQNLEVKLTDSQILEHLGDNESAANSESYYRGSTAGTFPFPDSRGTGTATTGGRMSRGGQL